MTVVPYASIIVPLLPDLAKHLERVRTVTPKDMPP